MLGLGEKERKLIVNTLNTYRVNCDKFKSRRLLFYGWLCAVGNYSRIFRTDDAAIILLLLHIVNYVLLHKLKHYGLPLLIPLDIKFLYKTKFF